MDRFVLKKITGVSVILVLTAVMRADDNFVQPLTAVEIREQIEAAAARYIHFATEDIISNRPTNQGWPAELVAEQAKVMDELRQWSAYPKALRLLIDHADGKVRTLVLGALFVSEESQQLPVIASLVDDKAIAFKHVPFSLNSFGMRGNQGKNVDDPQTVGEVAETMLSAYVPHRFQKPGSRFDEYWQARKDRRTCASWFLIRMQRATRNQTPIQPAYQRDIQRVSDDLNALPVADRAWTQVYLRCASPGQLQDTVTDAACIESLRELGSDAIVRLLKRERFTDDPDLWFEELGGGGDMLHSWMSHFILRHPLDLLRVEDVPVLLECEEVGRKTPLFGGSPYWAAAAAELVGQSDPAAASVILKAALERFPLQDILGGQKQAVLMGSLWRIEGAGKKQHIADWFYEAQALVVQRKSDQSNHGPEDFLKRVQNDKRPDTKELMATLETDRRFEQADWPVLKMMLEIANEGLLQPLVSREEIYRAFRTQKAHDETAQKRLDDWRRTLISHYAR